MLLFGTKKVDGHTSPKYSVVFCTLADDRLWCKRDIKYKTCNIWEGRVWTSRWLNLEFLLRNNDVRPRHLAPVSIFPLVGQLHGRVQWLLQHATIVTVGHLFFWQFHPTVAEGFAVEGWAFFFKDSFFLYSNTTDVQILHVFLKPDRFANLSCKPQLAQRMAKQYFLTSVHALFIIGRSRLLLFYPCKRKTIWNESGASGFRQRVVAAVYSSGAIAGGAVW